jgi:hypothetical protein
MINVDGTAVPLELGDLGVGKKTFEAVLGRGNAKKLTKLPMGCRMGDNANACLVGFRLWEGAKL